MLGHSIPTFLEYGPIRFAQKISRNTVPVDLLWEENTVLTEKTIWKRRIIREANMAICVLKRPLVSSKILLERANS